MRKSNSDSGLTAKRSHRLLAVGLTAILMAVCCALPCAAVETIIVGEVVNDETGEPIPNVNIRFRGTKIGTTSDEQGNYLLRVDMTGKAQLVFSAVGYHSQRFDVEPGTMAGLQVALHERTAALTELVVTPADNPALEVLRRVREHRQDNDRTLHPEITSTMHREQTLFISQINRKHLRRALWHSLQSGMIMQEDSTYIMPLYRETQSFRLTGTEMIPANDQRAQAIVMTPTDYSVLLNIPGNLNFYQSHVSIMGHAFLSPLAPSGNLYYRYYILDDDSITHHTSNITHQTSHITHPVRIAFRTRNPFYATFNGEMLIDTASFTLRAIRADVPPEVAVNYINNIHISQTLAEDHSLLEEHISALFDFAVKTEQTATVFPTVLLTTSLIDKQKQLATSSNSGLSSSSEAVSDASYQPVSASSAQSAQSMAALDSLPIVRTAKWFATIATTGYIPTGTPVDIGHVQEILQVSKHEGVHVGLPFRTNERFSRVVSLEAAVGYGFRDRAFKGLGRVSINLPTLRKNTLHLEYQDHYVWSEVDDFDRLTRENSMGFGNFDFTAYAFEALHRDSLCATTAMRQRQLQLHWFADWSELLETHAYVRAGWNNDLAHLSPYTAPPAYAYQSLSLIARLSWGERKYDGFFMRRYAYSTRYPVLFLGLEAGHWSLTAKRSHSVSGLTGEAGLYAHLRVMLTHHAQLGIGGTLTYTFRAGAIFGAVPATMLWQANANQGYAYDPYRFTLLHGGELLADKYLTLHTEWNGHGILFNLIPGIRWLHLRELVEAKLAYGYQSHSVSGLTGEAGLTAQAVSQRSGLTGEAGHRLYAEAGIGIGNILRVCDLYSVWALVPTSSPLAAQTQGSAFWAIRFRIHLGL